MRHVQVLLPPPLSAVVTVLMVVIFPGFLFLMGYAFYLEWVDRKFYADQQHRIGPLHTGWRGILQPLADFVKLMAKEDITPAAVDKIGFTLTPILALAIPISVLMLVPIAISQTPFFTVTGIMYFEGDLLMIGFFSTIFTIMLFIAGWSSSNRFGFTGAIRGIVQMLAYEIPLLLALFAAGMVAGNMSLTGVVVYQANLGLPLIVNPAFIGLFIVFIIAVQAETERIPFDAPVAETEIVGGWETEYSGKKLAFFRLSNNFEVLLAAALGTAVFLGGPLGPEIFMVFLANGGFVHGITINSGQYMTWVAANMPFLLNPALAAIYYAFWFIVKTTIIVLILSNMKALMSRWRIDQIALGSWKWVIPISLLMVGILLAWPFIMDWVVAIIP
ncbi:MAG: NADH-quinone oxidoreductase subunit H [Promethearchaeota archaeon]